MDDAAPLLEERMQFYSTHPDVDRVQSVKRSLEEVKSIMLENIDRVLERGERIDVLVDKTDHLAFDSLNFRSEARRLRTAMAWRQTRNMVLVAGAGASVLYLGLASLCGWSFDKC